MWQLLASTTALLLIVLVAPAPADHPHVQFKRTADRVVLRIDGRPLATYVFRDAKILRPYLMDVHAPSGVRVTRNQPPVAGQDATDHETMHPGIWLAFGDLSGVDFWRNQGRVEHVEFVAAPREVPQGGEFVVRNRYVGPDGPLCDEVCKISVWARPQATLLTWESEFQGQHEFYFGDQEEMGLGIRVATPITVKHAGTLTNSLGGVNEKQVWGQQAAWCDYSGQIDGARAGMMIVPDPLNFRPSWFHARDYGLLVANPFGVRAFSGGDPGRVTIPVGKTLKLRFAVVVHAGDVGLAQCASDAVTQLNAGR